MNTLISPKIQDFLKNKDLESPILVVDLEHVKRQYQAITGAIPFAKCHYAVKANPAPEIVKLLVGLGSSFDAASRQEIDLCMEHGASADKILFGNPIKKQADIEYAFKKGVDRFVCDSMIELEKIADAAPGSKVFCRIRVGGEAGAKWPLSKKFGCNRDICIEILKRAKERGLIPYGISFHVGSQQTVTEPYYSAIAIAELLFDDLAEEGIELQSLNIGGGFPAHYSDEIPPIEDFAETIKESIDRNFEGRPLEVIMEPGRFIVADAGVLQAEVVLISYNKEASHTRWVYLDVGKFTGLIEAEAIAYRIISSRVAVSEAEESRVILAGPTCDSIDIIYEETEYYLPNSLAVGDKIYFISAGAYTTSYSSVNFNGFPPLKCYCI